MGIRASSSAPLLMGLGAPHEAVEHPSFSPQRGFMVSPLCSSLSVLIYCLGREPLRSFVKENGIPDSLFCYCNHKAFYPYHFVPTSAWGSGLAAAWSRLLPFPPLAHFRPSQCWSGPLAPHPPPAHLHRRHYPGMSRAPLPLWA